jgi:Zn-finger nucleic acid-binding protein
MEEVRQRDAFIDNCNTCKGTFFDEGEMYAALGTSADPSLWDRPETGGAVRPGEIHCPRCGAAMLLQDVKHEDLSVEIDRCPNCRGIWLDGGEAAKIMKIGSRMAAVVIAERREARDELDKMGDVDFSPPSLIYRFLKLFRQ